MKQFLFVISVILIAVSSNAQEKDKPFKKANTIIIKAPYVKDTLLNKLSLILALSGYGIENKDIAAGIINSTERGPKGTNVTVKIVGIVSDSTIILRGQFKYNVAFSLGGVSSVPSYEDIRYGGMKGSPLRDAWNELDRIAAKIDNSTIIYAIN